jgi:hypothetical protein
MDDAQDKKKGHSMQKHKEKKERDGSKSCGPCIVRNKAQKNPTITTKKEQKPTTKS